MESERVAANVSGRARVAIACGSKAAVRAYGKLCDAEGVARRIYTSDSDDAQKREDFRDPHAAWEDVGCVIFTSTLSVAVNPTDVTFGKLFLHTCGTRSTLRDQFQGICRFGRAFDDQLFDATIDALLDGRPPTADEETSKKLPTFEAVRPKVVRHGAAKHLAELQARVGARGAAPAYPPWVQDVQTWALRERKSQQDVVLHTVVFRSLAALRGWPVEEVTDPSAFPIYAPPAGRRAPKSLAAVLWDDTEAYDELCATVLREKGEEWCHAHEPARLAAWRRTLAPVPLREKLEEKGEAWFFEDCFGFAALADKTAEQHKLLSVFYKLCRLRELVSQDVYKAFCRRDEVRRLGRLVGNGAARTEIGRLRLPCRRPHLCVRPRRPLGSAIDGQTGSEECRACHVPRERRARGGGLCLRRRHLVVLVILDRS